MSRTSERLRYEAEAELAFQDMITIIDPISWVNSLVLFVSALYFGAPWWKAIIIAIVALLATRLHYGRRLLVKASIAIMILTLLVWSGTLPDLGWIPSAAQACFKSA
jgi:hypothetical protein